MQALGFAISFARTSASASKPVAALRDVRAAVRAAASHLTIAVSAEWPVLMLELEGVATTTSRLV